MKGYIKTDNFGLVMVIDNPRAKRMIARWKDTELNVTVPAGISEEKIKEFLNNHETAIRALSRKEVHYTMGQVLHLYGGCTITIEPKDFVQTDVISGCTQREKGYVWVNPNADLDDVFVKKSISNMIEKILDAFARVAIIFRARQVAARVGAQPKRWEIGRGKRLNGCCTQNGTIRLSHNLMLLPEELIDLVICHELAHLEHFDHSPAFHALVNKYVGGREQELEHKLKHFDWPIVK